MTKKKDTTKFKEKLLVDTCVWLDLAKDYRQQPVIGALEDLVAAGVVELVAPQIVIDEFERNKARVIADTQRSLQSHFRLVREAVSRFGEDESKGDILDALNEVDHRIITKGEAVNDSFARIERLLQEGTHYEVNDSIKRRVAERAIAGKAPFHRGKNSAGDAVLVEICAELVAGRRAKRGAESGEADGRGSRPRKSRTLG